MKIFRLLLDSSASARNMAPLLPIPLTVVPGKSEKKGQKLLHMKLWCFAPVEVLWCFLDIDVRRSVSKIFTWRTAIQNITKESEFGSVCKKNSLPPTSRSLIEVFVLSNSAMDLAPSSPMPLSACSTPKIEKYSNKAQITDYKRKQISTILWFRENTMNTPQL